MSMAKAFLFDLNGTMIDDMQYHITAWHRILNDLGANLTLEQMRDECYGKNHELLERIFPARFSEEEKNRMSIEKEKAYQQNFRPHLKLINGLDRFLEESYQRGIRMAIGSAAIRFNIDFVLDGLNIRKYFSTIISADDVLHSKPDPETYLKCAGGLGVDPVDCIVFEDAPKGVAAARNAGMRSVVITLMHPKEDFAEFENVLTYINNFDNIAL